MKAVILAGGKGTRIMEESVSHPKPMVQIGGKPILWHIMKLYAAYGVQDFIICCGYKGYMIKEYFANYALHMSDVTVDLQQNRLTWHQNYAEPWRVTLVDTGLNTMTGGRLKRIADYLDDETFCLTYGDGLADLDLRRLLQFHRGHGKQLTVTAVNPPSRFGTLSLEGDEVVAFEEKPVAGEGLINGGFFVAEPAVLELIEGDHTVWEEAPMRRLAARRQLAAYRHVGFWQPMDMLRDKEHLETLWNQGRAPWKKWT